MNEKQLDYIERKIKEGRPFFKKNFINDIFSWEEFEKVINDTPKLNYNRLHVLNEKYRDGRGNIGRIKPPWLIPGYKKPIWQASTLVWPPSLIQVHLEDSHFYLSEA